ncbi:MAG: shikimate kinase [Firmicutes bacterium]|nr:shikimate kinase [Bacillota bacterium]MBR7148789.1 shikimate kinase [Bacillota bacterium]
MKKSVVLIGMPAAGKSTVGVVLAKTLGKQFVDTDLLIQDREGMLLQEIINTKGNDYFRQVEEEVLSELDLDHAVIATGGSAIYYPKAMENLAKLGPIIYLQLSVPTLKKRLSNIKTRGITMAPGQTIEDLARARIPLYEAYADIVMPTEGLDVEETIERICIALKNFKKR